MARPQHPWGILEGLIYDMKKKTCFDPIFGLCMMYDNIISQFLPILDER